MIKLKRVYEKPARNDGLRILVDPVRSRGRSVGIDDKYTMARTKKMYYV